MEELKIKKVAMTGGSGPIGLALMRKLFSEGVQVTLFQRKNSVKSAFLPENKLLTIEYYRLDELDLFQTNEQDFDVFFHLGWDFTGKNDRVSLEKQLKNVEYTLNAIRLAKRLGCHSFIGAGSQAEYGIQNEIITCNTVCKPESAYGVTKNATSIIAQKACDDLNIRFLWPRILSGYGIFDNLNSLFVSSIIKAYNGEKLLFSKGEQIWDFVYLDDIGDALYHIAQRGKNHAKYPIGSGDAKTIHDYIEIMLTYLDVDVEYEIGAIPYSPNQIMHLEADSSTLSLDTGWKPKTNFDEGIQKTIAFYKDWLSENQEIVKILREF